MLRSLARTALNQVTHTIGRISGRYYFEDYGRVYPDGVRYDRLGRLREVREEDVRNFLNHQKFYRFAGQFAPGRRVADVGCGSGYGCEILKQSGALEVHGCDVSRTALAFARERFGGIAEFTEQGISDLHGYTDASFDVTISSEVLEHIKEYGLEAKALDELRRVTRAGGIVIIATPSSELLGDHGFHFEEIKDLVAARFRDYVIFENALVPDGAERDRWERRRAEGSTGTIVSERIVESETVLLPGQRFETKDGLEPGVGTFRGIEVDTRLLHNTHSWVVVARR